MDQGNFYILLFGAIGGISVIVAPLLKLNSNIVKLNANMEHLIENILNQAKLWLGKKESDGSHKQIIDVYNGHKPLARGYKVKYTDNWCATFVSACAIKANLSNIIPLECSCGEMIELAKQMNIWNENDDITPKAGDIIMYDWDNQDGWPEHVGIVESVTNNQITVIEGNKSNAVGRRVINVGNASIRGYIQPNYDGSVTNNQPSKPISNEKAVNYKVKYKGNLK